MQWRSVKQDRDGEIGDGSCSCGVRDGGGGCDVGVDSLKQLRVSSDEVSAVPYICDGIGFETTHGMLQRLEGFEHEQSHLPVSIDHAAEQYFQRIVEC